jgi:peptide deformylase
MTKIITCPNFDLRRRSAPVTKIDKRLFKLLKQLEQTLIQGNIGVGLAAPQLGVNLRLFGVYFSHEQTSEVATQLPQQTAPPTFKVFINPQITAQAPKLTLGSKKHREFEGCLSVPKIYAPVWRPEWLELSYDELVKEKLVRRQVRLEGFMARIVAHEYDHLEGVLFIDHVLKQGTPIYLENSRGELEEISREQLEQIFGSW